MRRRQGLGVFARRALGSVVGCAAIVASASAVLAVTPVLECVDDNLNGTYTAHFGYNNTNVMTVTIAVGSNNKFIPDPQNRSQPTTFLPGRQFFVFSVVWDGSSLAWFLDSHTATASSSSARCSTPTPTASATATGTATATATGTATPTPTDTDTPQPSATATETATATVTSTATASATATETETPTPPPTATSTATDTAATTATHTPTPAETPTQTPAETPTQTPAETPTATATETVTLLATATDTETPAATATLTATAGGTATASAVATLSATATGTATTTPTPTRTGICALTPVSGCATPVGFKKPLHLSNKRDVAAWRWRAIGNIPVADFGNPLTTTSYSLCVYAGAPATLVLELRAPAGGTCAAGKPCWKQRVSKGFRYRDLDATPDGVTRLVLRTAVGHLADLALKAHGPNIPFPPMPLDLPVVAQLVKSDGPECWQSNYSAPAIKNTSQAYKDKND